MALKSLSSASLAKSAMGWASPGKNPPLRSRRTSLSSLSLSCAVVKPHQAGDAYSMEARVVIRATSWTWVGPRPCDRSIRRACMDIASYRADQSEALSAQGYLMSYLMSYRPKMLDQLEK